jgi:hypothetical protein
LEKFYNTGFNDPFTNKYHADTDSDSRYGEPLGPVQGVGYVSKLIVWLMNSPAQDQMQVSKECNFAVKTAPGLRFVWNLSPVAVFATKSHSLQDISLLLLLLLLLSLLSPSAKL